MAKIPNFANIPFAGAEANEQAAQEWLTQLKAETGKSFDETSIARWNKLTWHRCMTKVPMPIAITYPIWPVYRHIYADHTLPCM